MKRLQAATLCHVSVSGRERGEEEPRSVTVKGAPAAVEAGVSLIYGFFRAPDELESLLDEAAAAESRRAR